MADRQISHLLNSRSHLSVLRVEFAGSYRRKWVLPFHRRNYIPTYTEGTHIRYGGIQRSGKGRPQDPLNVAARTLVSDLLVETSHRMNRPRVAVYC